MKRKNIGKNSNKIVYIILGIFILVLFTLLILGCFYQKREIYEIKNRTKEIEEYKKEYGIVDSSNGLINDYKTISWLRVQGTNIDLPIIYPGKEELGDGKNHNPTNNDYLWTLEETEKLMNRVNVYGHNIMNLSKQPLLESKDFARFDNLMSFVYYEFVKENKYIQYTIDGKNYLYKIFSVNFIEPKDIDYLTVGINVGEENRSDYIKKSLERSIYDFDVDVNKKDKIITLITCTRMYDNREFLVEGRLLREGEKATNYKVNPSSRYREVEKILKGDEENEKA